MPRLNRATGPWKSIATFVANLNAKQVRGSQVDLYRLEKSPLRLHDSMRSPDPWHHCVAQVPGDSRLLDWKNTFRVLFS